MGAHGAFEGELMNSPMVNLTLIIELKLTEH